MAHLFWNMFALYNLGPILEDQFQTYFGELWFLWFGIFYFTTAVLSDIPSAIQHRNDEQYSTLGASGAVSAVIAAASIIDLKLELYIYGIPMYGWLYLVIYLIVSFFLSRRSQQSVNHLAHASGALVAVAIAFLIAHAGIITSVYPTSQDYKNGHEDSVEVMELHMTIMFYIDAWQIKARKAPVEVFPRLSSEIEVATSSHCSFDQVQTSSRLCCDWKRTAQKFFKFN